VIARRLSLLLVALVMAACSIPSWVPLVGKSKAQPNAPASVAGPPKSAPLLTATAPTPAAPAPGEVVDRVLCVVNNDAVTQYELDEAEAYYLYENKMTSPPEGEARVALRKELLDRIVEGRLQLQQAEREKITVEDAEVQEQLTEIMKKLNAPAAKDFEEVLKQQGLSLDGVKRRIRDQILVTRVTRRKVALRISVTEQEIDAYIGANRGKLETGLTFEARHILFLPVAGEGEEGWEAARKKAEQVYGQVKEGKDFAMLAKEYSEDPSAKDGGSLGTLKRGELTPEIEVAILSLQPGESSPPIRSPVGYHLFHLDAKETLSGEALTQARSQIRDILYREKYDARLKEWITEIKQRSLIDIRL